ncbi:MAG: protein-tyrosine-phosphatase [Bacteroidota bacterium]
MRKLLPPVADYLDVTMPMMDALPPVRKQLLDPLSDFINQRLRAPTCRLVFICTHNSRRSHISQIWAQVAAYYYGLDHIETYSGGTEATAFHLNAVEAMRRSGLAVESTDDSSNPIYNVRFASDQAGMRVFSKTYDDDANPKADFGAVMTCSHADENCPVVFGAAKRISLHYEDPKEADGTSEVRRVYDERVRQIATELMYVMKNVKARP